MLDWPMVRSSSLELDDSSQESEEYCCSKITWISLSLNSSSMFKDLILFLRSGHLLVICPSFPHPIHVLGFFCKVPPKRLIAFLLCFLLSAWFVSTNVLLLLGGLILGFVRLPMFLAWELIKSKLFTPRAKFSSNSSLLLIQLAFKFDIIA